MADVPVFNPSLALAENPAYEATPVQKAMLAALAAGLLVLLVCLFSDLAARYPVPMFTLGGGLTVGGGLLYVVDRYRRLPPGVRN